MTPPEERAQGTGFGKYSVSRAGCERRTRDQKKRPPLWAAAAESRWGVNGERRTGGGLGGQADERPGEIIAGDAVGFQTAAGTTAMDNGPFAVAFHPDADGLHGAAADRGAVAGGFVHVKAPEAPAAVVAMGAAVGVRVDGALAVFADEAIGTMAVMVGHDRDPCRWKGKREGNVDKGLRTRGDT